tara:strand:+ start:159 stop:1436 length:1278 start_codon:yes stop_codon:yes gene_type:complete
MEDAMMAYRIVRAGEKRVYYIDVGAIPPNEVEQYMQKVMTSMKRNTIVDENSGRVDLRYNPLSVEEDIYIPVRGNNKSEIVTLPGGTNATAIDDVKYLRDKMFSALKIPTAYLTQGEGQMEDKTTLATKDIRFSRTIQRLQRVAISELEKIGIIHLYTLGHRGEDLLSFKLSLNNPSKIAEMQELEYWSTKFDVASKATEGFFSRRWIAEHLFNISEEAFLRNQREIFYDRKYDAQITAVAEKTQEEMSGFGGDLGGGLGRDLEAGEAGIGADPGDLGAPEGEAGAEADLGAEEGGDILLATPEGGVETAPVTEAESEVTRKDKWGKTEKRRRGPSGSTYYYGERPRNNASRRNVLSMKDQAGVSKDRTRTTPRTNMPGRFELKNLTTGNLYENATNYNVEERQLFATKTQVEALLESLEKKNET